MKDMVKVFAHSDSSSWSFEDSDVEAVTKQQTVDDGGLIIDDAQMSKQFESTRKLALGLRGAPAAGAKQAAVLTRHSVAGADRAEAAGAAGPPEAKGGNGDYEHQERQPALATVLGLSQLTPSAGSKKRGFAQDKTPPKAKAKPKATAKASGKAPAKGGA